MAIIPERRRWTTIRALSWMALALLPLALALGASPQEKPVKDYALIYGTVFGPDGLSRYGVPVKIRLKDAKKARWEAVSDHSGEFAVRVPTGTADYVIWADIKVPKGEPRPETTAHIEANERVDVALHLKK